MTTARGRQSLTALHAITAASAADSQHMMPHPKRRCCFRTRKFQGNSGRA